jgi:hypothetical protein
MVEGPGSPAFGRLRHPLGQFYEFGISISIPCEVERDVAAQCARDAPAAQRALQAVMAGGAWVQASAEVGPAPGQGAAGIDYGALGARPTGVAGGGEAHELGLRRDAPAAYAAAPGHVARYGACPPALSWMPALSAGAAIGGAACGAASGGATSGAASPLVERSATLSLAMLASAWWVSRPQ